MKKYEFLSELKNRLSGLPQEDIEKTVDYYSEIIDDRIEDGIKEEDAIKAIGSIDDVVSKILSDTSLPKLVKSKVKPKRTLKFWEILLIILGSPIWFSLLLAVVIIFFAIYIVLWTVVFVSYVVMAAFGVCGIYGLLAMIPLAVSGNIELGLALLGIGFSFSGLTILLFHLSNLAAKGVAMLSKKILIGIKHCFFRKAAE